MPDSFVAVTAGSGTNIDTITAPSGDHRQVVFTADRGGFTGRASTSLMAGIAGMTGQRIFSIHNATGSSVAVAVNQITVDLYQTAPKLPVRIAPIIRLYKVTVLPTGGQAVTKVSEDSGGPATSSSVTVLEHDLVLPIIATLPAGAVITQEFAPRLLSTVSHQAADRLEFLTGPWSIKLHPLEGIVVELAYTSSTQNPITDQWVVTCQWEEYVP